MTDDHIDTTDTPDQGADQGFRSDVADASTEDDVEVAVVTMRFDASDNAALLGILSKYVVLTRMVEGCRNVDLCSSMTTPGRHLIIQKWDDVDAQRAHFDSDLMVEMAKNCAGLLSAAPEIDLYDATSAHDLR